jgi:hypothetical protein
MILALSNAPDATTRLVLRRLREKGAQVTQYSVAEMPARSQVSAWLGNGGAARARIRRERGDIDFDAVRTVWFRRLSPFHADPELSDDDREFAENESRAFLWSLGVTLADRFWVNPLVEGLATDRGNGKVSQLEVARRVGFAIPRTLATNDPDAAREFLSTLTEGAIYKPFQAPTRNVAEEGQPAAWATVFTNRLDERALSRLDGVRVAPCIFQELIPKAVELRVTAIGHRVFATAIHSQVNEKSAVDFRRHYGLGETPYAVHELPPEVTEHCLALNRALGLVYGSIDLVLTPDGRYVFLEVNEQGQFGWLEEMTGQPLLEHLCEMLIQGRADYDCQAPLHAPGPYAKLPELPPNELIDDE